MDHKIKLAPEGAKCHPSKVAVFSVEDLKHEIDDLMVRPAVDIDGEVMKMWVSVLVPKGSIFIIDKEQLFEKKDYEK